VPPRFPCPQKRWKTSTSTPALLKRDQIAHLGTLDLVYCQRQWSPRPPGTGKRPAIGLASATAKPATGSVRQPPPVGSGQHSDAHTTPAGCKRKLINSAGIPCDRRRGRYIVRSRAANLFSPTSYSPQPLRTTRIPNSSPATSRRPMGEVSATTCSQAMIDRLVHPPTVVSLKRRKLPTQRPRPWPASPRPHQR